MRPEGLAGTPVLFRVAAGPRIGFGHLKRCTALARALGVQPLVSLRGGRIAREVARRLGCELIDGRAADVVRRLRPELLVVDDPVARQGWPWARAAKAAASAVAAVRDMGHGLGHADLIVDGSVAPAALPGKSPARLWPRTHLTGARYALIDPILAKCRTRRASAEVVIALGGGRHARAARRLARELARRRPDLRIRIVGGLVPGAKAAREGRVSIMPPVAQLGPVLAACTMAIVSGGMTAYEACCLGTPAVAVSVVAAQRPAVRGLAARGAVVDGGALGSSSRSASGAAAAVERLLAEPAHRRRLARAGAKLVDGRGILRTARALTRLAQERRR
jgi:UDP-2,4-diacetamido-2,4,6-trideoxy-beta-L-altropyranose hydrolase